MMNKFAIIQIGDNSIDRYEKNKITVDIYNYPNTITEFELEDELSHLQEFYDRVIVQLPFPPHIRQEVAMAAVDSDKLVIVEEESNESSCIKNE